MAPRWRWLLVTLAALAVSCVVPGSMLSQSPDRWCRCHRHCTRACAHRGASAPLCRAIGGRRRRRCPFRASAWPARSPPGSWFSWRCSRVRRARRVEGTLPAGTPSPLLRPRGTSSAHKEPAPRRRHSPWSCVPQRSAVIEPLAWSPHISPVPSLRAQRKSRHVEQAPPTANAVTEGQSIHHNRTR